MCRVTRLKPGVNESRMFPSKRNSGMARRGKQLKGLRGFCALANRSLTIAWRYLYRHRDWHTYICPRESGDRLSQPKMRPPLLMRF